MKIKIFAGFVLGVALTSAIFLATNVEAIVQNPTPIITSVAPNSGSTIGGEVVTITGGYMDEVNQVLFDSLPAQIQTVSNNAMVVITPPHSAGFVNVTATNSEGSAVATNAYLYIAPPPPSILSLAPASGPIEGGVSVTITGSFLSDTQTVSFDGLSATIVSSNDSQVVVTTPAHEAGFVDVIVATASGTASIVSAYEYIDTTPPPPVPIPPSITSLNPNEGPVDGGTAVTIYGTNLDTVNHVLFDSLEAVIVSATVTELVVTSPAHAVGSVSITVINPDGSTAFGSGFTYTQGTNPPAYTYCDWHDNGNNWGETKWNGKNDHQKALVCHAQSKPKDTFKTLCLPLEAIPAHLAHGDELGYCVDE